jgi:hypothetical protein
MRWAERRDGLNLRLPAQAGCGWFPYFPILHPIQTMIQFKFESTKINPNKIQMKVQFLTLAFYTS